MGAFANKVYLENKIKELCGDIEGLKSSIKKEKLKKKLNNTYLDYVGFTLIYHIKREEDPPFDRIFRMYKRVNNL